jgi:chemotaxis protein methyltransferase CheR
MESNHMNNLQLNQIPLSDREMKLFQNFIYQHAGIKMGPQKKSLIQNRLRKRLIELELSSYKDYYNFLTDPANRNETQLCLNALTTNETYFFRHKQHWDFLITVIVPEWKRRNTCVTPFRFWSAAGSTGEEPYSAAIALHSLLSKENYNFTVEATDINAEVINKAKLGIYNDYSIQKLTKLCLSQYFFHNTANNTYQLSDEIKRHVTYTQHNLLSKKIGPKFDIVFLRNVMIYFDDSSKQTVIENITEKIKPDGYLILGGAEGLSACREQYEYVKPTIFRKIKS